MATPGTIVIIGVGNDYRTDDAAGLAAARELGDLHLSGVRAIDGIADGTDMINAWKDARTAFVIDSVRSGAEPGTIYRFDGLTDPITENIFPGYSTHAFSIPDTINLARTLGQLPSFLIVYGIEARSFSSGRGLSPEVAAGVESVVQKIRLEIERR